MEQEDSGVASCVVYLVSSRVDESTSVEGSVEWSLEPYGLRRAAQVLTGRRVCHEVGSERVRHSGKSHRYFRKAVTQIFHEISART